MTKSRISGFRPRVRLEAKAEAQAAKQLWPEGHKPPALLAVDYQLPAYGNH